MQEFHAKFARFYVLKYIIIIITLHAHIGTLYNAFRMIFNVHIEQHIIQYIRDDKKRWHTIAAQCMIYVQLRYDSIGSFVVFNISVYLLGSSKLIKFIIEYYNLKFTFYTPDSADGNAAIQEKSDEKYNVMVFIFHYIKLIFT